jgi:hypothetical protein
LNLDWRVWGAGACACRQVSRLRLIRGAHAESPANVAQAAAAPAKQLTSPNVMLDRLAGFVEYG